MSTIRFVAPLCAGLIAVLGADLLACGGGGNNASSGDGGVDATDDGSGLDAARDGGSEAGKDSGGGTDTGSQDDGGLTEPAYLRNDALAGFAFTADYGSPYDSILGAPLNTTQSAIAPGYKTTPGPGQIVANERYLLVANSSDLYTALDISASLSVSSGLASVNAKTDFAKTTQIDTTSLTVLVDLSQYGPVQKIVSPALTSQAAALSPDQFYALYGDRYAAEIVTGAEMFCTVSISTFSQADKTTLTASLGFSYGASSGSAMFASTVASQVSNRTVNVNCQYLGYSPTTIVNDLTTLQAAETAFQQGAVGTLGNVTTSALYLLYTSYYGIPGYLGVPTGTAAKVAQEGQIASDYLLYDSLVSKDFALYYGDPTYSGLPFFGHMKAYRDALTQYLVALNTNSQNPGVAVPTAQADGLISNWVTAKGASSASGATPQFETYALSNGIVPKKIADYAIPLRYSYADAAGNGALNGTTFTPTITVPPPTSIGTTSPVDYPLYLVNRAGSGGGLALEYQWDTGTYSFPNTTTNGQPDPNLINAAISAFALTGELQTQYVIVSKANGLVMTDMGGSNGMAATHAVLNSASQQWNFYLDNGAGNCTAYFPQAVDAGAPGVNCTANGNYPNGQCGSGIYAISQQAIINKTSSYWNTQAGTGGTIIANGGGGCQHCDSSCTTNNWCQYTSCSGGPSPWDLFFLQPWNSGTTQAIYNYAGSAGGTVSWVTTSPTLLPLPPSGTLPDGGVVQEPVVVGGNTGQENELWVFIPLANVDNP